MKPIQPQPERLGSFFPGAEYDSDAGETAGAPVHYDARDLTTHAVCVGMTSSGQSHPRPCSPSRCFLENLVSWMSRQPGATSLRALLYFDEIFGFLPPVAEPPPERWSLVGSQTEILKIRPRRTDIEVAFVGIVWR